MKTISNKVNKDLNQGQKNVACPELGTAQPQLVIP